MARARRAIVARCRARVAFESRANGASGRLLFVRGVCVVARDVGGRSARVGARRESRVADVGSPKTRSMRSSETLAGRAGVEDGAVARWCTHHRV